MDPLLLTGIVQGLSTFGIDSLLGSDVEEKQDDYLKKLRDIVGRLKKDAGKSTSDSIFFKTAMKLLDDKYGEDLKKLQGQQAIAGATNEAQLGTMDRVNRGRNDAQVRTLAVAEGKRQSLLDRAESLDLKGDEMEIGMAEQTNKNVSALAPVATSGLTALINELKGKGVSSAAKNPLKYTFNQDEPITITAL